MAQSEIDAAYAACSTAQIEALRLAVRNIRRYHERQVEQGYTLRADGTTLMQAQCGRSRAWASTPRRHGGVSLQRADERRNAKVAGRARMPGHAGAKKGAVAPLTLVAAREAGVDEIYRMGGAQAVAVCVRYAERAAGGQDHRPRNLYVTLAKKGGGGYRGH